MRRRQFLTTSMSMAAAGAASVAGGRAAGAAPATPVAAPVCGPAEIVPAGWDDGLAQGDVRERKLGAGLERGVVLGGGASYLMSFYMGYLGTVAKEGIDLGQADILVGTSAGSFAATMLLTGMIDQFTEELGFLAQYPSVFAQAVGSGEPNPSQIRARQTFLDAGANTPETLLAIGRAAMAANNPAGPDLWPEHLKLILGGRTAWPSPKLHVTSNDCFTMERLLISEDAGVPINVACAASSSMAGSLGPVRVKDRLCTDGGNCATNVHADVVTGVGRALVVSLSDGSPEAVAQGLRETGIPDTLRQDIADLEAGGTEVFLVVAGLPEGVDKIDSILDPKYIAPMMTKGRRTAEADLDKLQAFWG